MVLPPRWGARPAPEQVESKPLQPGRTHRHRRGGSSATELKVDRRPAALPATSQNLVPFETLPEVPHEEHQLSHEEMLVLQQAFGYTFEDLRVFLGPMARLGRDPVGSMGNDAALAVLSDRPQLLYNYFKQLFAQVTNPPIDPIREELISPLPKPPWAPSATCSTRGRRAAGSSGPRAPSSGITSWRSCAPLSSPGSGAAPCPCSSSPEPALRVWRRRWRNCARPLTGLSRRA